MLQVFFILEKKSSSRPIRLLLGQRKLDWVTSLRHNVYHVLLQCSHVFTLLLFQFQLLMSYVVLAFLYCPSCHSPLSIVAEMSKQIISKRTHTMIQEQKVVI